MDMAGLASALRGSSVIFMLVHAGIACICPWLPLGFNDVTSGHADSTLYSLGAMIAGEELLQQPAYQSAASATVSYRQRERCR